ncbi:TonB-dependent receptor family protein [Litorimonas sp. RW-G-Af-16]|uniref:TonB-dependent receptor family protein n=1 Tax=Litorimonas sp. RW-G-Af-16 TaxID=3241168 RepID=UPI00390C5079
MTFKTSASLLALTTACLIATPSFAQDSDATAPRALNAIDTITVIGTVNSVDDVTGSITFIGPEELALQSYSDINRVLRAAPGVNIQEEDGYGLRPNIGIRGSGADRSSKVVIMEDGVLMAPAPYSAPAAYYFPVTGRMSAVELTKGPATIKYGPNTTAGALQLFSTPIPTEAKAHADIMVSDLGRVKAHAYAGNRFEAGDVDLGFLIETYQDHADGFKDLDTGDTGFDVEDYVLKGGIYGANQSLELKFQYKDEVSDETYLGLTQADFDTNPYQRYNASQLDQMTNDHKTYQLTHNIDLGDSWNLTTIAYRAEFARNWFKLDRFDNSQLSGSGDCNALDEILRAPVLCSAEFEVLQGAAGYVSPDDVLQLRANNRTYYAQGIQSAVAGEIDAGGITHNLTASIRYHEDEVDRFQEQDGYRIDNSRLVLTTDNAPGTQANRLSDAKALSAYVEDRIVINDMTVTAGLRVEDVSTSQRRWNTPDRALAPDSARDNDYTKWLPALSAKYDITDQVSILGGVHKGFSAAPVSSRQSTDSESSTVFEGGMRYRGDSGFKLDAIGFFNDYSNLLGECTNSSGGNECDIGDAFNAGEVDVYGLELTASHDLADSVETGLSIPVSLAYSFTESEIKTSFSDSFWGDVVAGDALPYVPRHQLTVSAGVHGDRFGIDAVVNTVSTARNVAGQGDIPASEKVGPRTVVDAAAYYDLKDGVRLKLKVENLLDDTYVAARRPYGLRPGKPREVFAGLALDF